MPQTTDARAQPVPVALPVQPGQAGPGPSKPVFILGVGAQKAGTSWLHRQLCGLPGVDMGFQKEYHVWDAVHVASCARYRLHPQRGESETRHLRALMQDIDGVYETYFARLIDGGVRWTGDITPSYALLDEAALARLRSRLEAAGFAVRVVFLMRDPVARNWSALRMHASRRAERGGRAATPDAVIAEFPRAFRTPNFIDRTRYDRTVKAVRGSFEKADIHFGFHETLFTPEGLAQLSRFLGLDLTNAATDARVNAAPPLDLPAPLRAECRAFHEEVYAFCHREFPVTQALWP